MSLKMWSLFDSNKIREILEKIHKTDLPLTLWQHSTQNMYQFAGKFVEAQEYNCTIVLTEKWPKDAFNMEEAIYVHCPKKNVIFKREKFVFDTGEITFKTPSELMLKDRRRVERFHFKYQDFKVLSLRWKGKEGEERESFNLIDLSIAGLAFVGAADTLKDFRENDTLWVTHVTDQVLEEPCEAKVISIQPYYLKEGLRERTTNKEIMRVGLEFKVAVESVSFKSVQSLVKRTQERTRGLEIEGFNGLSSNDQMRTIKKVAEENKVLASQLLENVETLDRLRYLTSEMKKTFWLEVNQDLLAAALRLSSKELIYDLLCDVTENMRDDFLIRLDSPKPPAAIEKAQRSICDFIFQKEREGKFVLSPQSFVKYV